MGLAASQARFLCITARKADCEYKSTELAQQKLEITNQLSDISTEYSNAMNATKLVWSNDAVEGDFGVSYSLLMMPSAANDYNPYMITTSSGAIVLNSEYAAAAKAAGISKAGGIGSQSQRDKFIQALVPGGMVTQETANAITKEDFVAVKNADNSISFDATQSVSGTNGVDWNPGAGMGDTPLNKSNVSAMTLADIILSESIGQKQIDWAQLIIGEDEISSVEYNEEKTRLSKILKTANGNEISNDVLDQLTRDLKNKKSEKADMDPTSPEYADKTNEIASLETLIENAKKIMSGDYKNGVLLDDNGAETTVKVQDIYTAVKAQIQADYDAYEAKSASTVVPGDADNGGQAINTEGNSLKPGKATYSIVQNGVINHYKDEINQMTIGDILATDIVVVSNRSTDSSLNDFKDRIVQLFDSIVKAFGYSTTEDLTGQGLNVDDASSEALEFAYNMILKTYLSTKDVQDIGSRDSDKSMTENSAYQNAHNYNRIGSLDDGEYYAVSLSNMLSSFLTYYENALSGSSSSYVVGKSPETSVYVTDNTGYYYIVQDDEDAVTSTVNKSADFYDELYNNILEHGWREDAAIDDSEYLESAIKDGRYSMSSLNNDGYYYQTRYNDTGYIVEVSDTDAIARAEAEYTSKKAELTYKEDSIDLKTKNLDAEISSLTTEYDTVKSLISKSIEKTFTMFSS